MKSRVFIGSSSGAVLIARAIQANLDPPFEVTVWDQGVIRVGHTALDSLISQSKGVDFGIFVFAPDDTSRIRGRRRATVRDNVLFELGLFMGALGSKKCFIVSPRKSEELHIPTDLLGITRAVYDPDRQDKNLHAALAPACSQISREMDRSRNASSTGLPNLAGKWKSFYVDANDSDKFMVVEDEVNIIQRGDRIDGVYKCRTFDRDDFLLKGRIVDDYVLGYYSGEDTQKWGVGGFQFHVHGSEQWLEGFCTWANHPNKDIGCSKHIWYKMDCPKSRDNNKKAKDLMETEKLRLSTKEP